jgi:two-component system response regulator VicR
MEKPLAFVIEDDVDLNMIFSTALNAAGYAVETVKDGQKAIDRLEMIKPSLIILDLHLPNVTGEEILKHIRSKDKFDQTKVVLTTADHEKAASLESQADLVMVKPIGYTQLRDLATRLLPTSDS